MYINIPVITAHYINYKILSPYLSLILRVLRERKISLSMIATLIATLKNVQHKRLENDIS